MALKKREMSAVLGLASEAYAVSVGRGGQVDRPGKNQQQQLHESLIRLRDAVEVILEDLAV